MVDIAQQVEHLIVVQKVARSNRVIHPTKSSECQRSEDFSHPVRLRLLGLMIVAAHESISQQNSRV